MLVKCRWNGLYKYNSSGLQYRNYKVNDLLKNKPKHYVAVFKESLIYDDVSDFFERSYSLRESILWLHRIISHRSYNNKEVYISYRDYAVRRIMFRYTYKQIHVKYMKGNNELNKASPHPSVVLVHEIDRCINNNDKTDTLSINEENAIMKEQMEHKTITLDNNNNNNHITPVYKDENIIDNITPFSLSHNSSFAKNDSFSFEFSFSSTVHSSNHSNVEHKETNTNINTNTNTLNVNNAKPRILSIKTTPYFNENVLKLLNNKPRESSNMLVMESNTFKQKEQGQLNGKCKYNMIPLSLKTITNRERCIRLNQPLRMCVTQHNKNTNVDSKKKERRILNKCVNEAKSILQKKDNIYYGNNNVSKYNTLTIGKYFRSKSNTNRMVVPTYRRNVSNNKKIFSRIN